MGSVVSAQFGEDILDPAFDGFFGDRELICNLFVGIPDAIRRSTMISAGHRTSPVARVSWGVRVSGVN